MDRLLYKIGYTEYFLDRICNYISAKGISYFHHEQIKHHWFYNKILINTILIILLIIELTSLLSNNRRMSLMLGDMAFNWEFKSIWNLIIIIGISLTLLTSCLHYWHYKQGHIPIQLRNQANLTIGNNMHSMISLLEKYLIMIILIYPLFVVQMITFSISSTISELFTYGLFGSILMGISCLFVSQSALAHLCYFCLLAYNLKLKLELENIRLKQLSTKHLTKVVIERQLLRIISRIFKIYKQIKDENKFWSKWLLFQILLVTNFCSLFINQLVFGQNNMLIFIFFISNIMIIFIYIWIFSICCIKLHDESNKTVKIIRQFSFKLNAMKSTHFHGYKVNNF